jgi:hypothetical protein
MPYKITPNKGNYKVTSPSGVRAKGTTKTKARRQVNLLEGIEHGWKPSRKGAGRGKKR